MLYYPPTMHIDYLIVGVGNSLRGDDGAGWILAERLRSGLSAGGAAVQVRLVQQLLPELAAEIAEIAPASVVVADCTMQANSESLQRLEQAAPDTMDGHTLSAQQLLNLAVRLFDFDGSAWLATVAGSEFAHHEGLSVATQQALAANLPQMLAQLQASSHITASRDK